jgi:hypothetical protein
MPEHRAKHPTPQDRGSCEALAGVGEEALPPALVRMIGLRRMAVLCRLDERADTADFNRLIPTLSFVSIYGGALVLAS